MSLVLKPRGMYGYVLVYVRCSVGMCYCNVTIMICCVCVCVCVCTLVGFVCMYCEHVKVFRMCISLFV
ncbi:hypothetical protein EON63_17060 [archaeon]|nr:MAG: hypothetical protein EON63_17060 [archaeon]